MKKQNDIAVQYHAGIMAKGSGTSVLGVVTDAGLLEAALQLITRDGGNNILSENSIHEVFRNKNASEVLEIYHSIQKQLLENASWRAYADKKWIGTSAKAILDAIQQKIDFYNTIILSYEVTLNRDSQG